jgi:hypothetical protein
MGHSRRVGPIRSAYDDAEPITMRGTGDLANRTGWPNLLLIGANRAGTTSLFHELARHPGIFAGRTKETAVLTRSLMELTQKRNAIKKYFTDSHEYDYVMDASTQYSMFPRHKNVPEKAVNIFGKDIKVIYLIRDPVARTLSQLANEEIIWDTRTVDRVVAGAGAGSEGRLYDPYYHSLYDWQLEQWYRVLPSENIFVLVAEEWQNDRLRSIEKMSAFLRIDLDACLEFPPLQENAVEELREMPAAAYRFIKSDFYKLGIKQRVPPGLINVVKRALPRRQRLRTDHIAGTVATSMMPGFKRSIVRLIEWGTVEAATIAYYWGEGYVSAEPVS